MKGTAFGLVFALAYNFTFRVPYNNQIKGYYLKNSK